MTIHFCQKWHQKCNSLKEMLHRQLEELVLEVRVKEIENLKQNMESKMTWIKSLKCCLILI